MKTDAEPVLQENLLSVVKYSSAFSLGTLAAFLCSIREVNPHVRFGLSFLTVLAFILGAALSWALWRTVLDSGAQTRRNHVFFAFLSAIMVLGTVASYLIALASVPSRRLHEIMTGATAAVIVLTLLGILFWRVTRCFED